MSEVTHKTTVSLPIFGFLGVAFVVLKLTGYIDWSWWLVTLPFWFGLALFAGFMLIVLLVALIGVAVKD
jgi:hypothetical protein